jgi:hypothetical protein
MNSKTKKSDITLFSPHEGQQRIIKNVFDPNINYVTAACGRRFGKSICNINVATKWGLDKNDQNIVIVNPSADQKNEMFSEFDRVFFKAPFIKSINRSENDVLLQNGSQIKFRIGSFPAAENLRGKRNDLVIIDEAPLMRKDLWDSILSHTLATSKNPTALFTSTPRGRDWFYNNYVNGTDPMLKNWASVHAPSSANPLVNRDFLEDMKRTLSDKIYRQEILAEFLDDNGGLFENIYSNTHGGMFFPTNQEYYAGIDVGFIKDHTVVTIFDEKGNMVDILRFNEVEMRDSVKRIAKFLKKWRDPYTYIETNTYQGMLEMLIEEGVENIKGFNTNVKTKKEIIEDLVCAFQERTIKIPNEEYLLNEFAQFEYSYNPKTRHITYGAPQGQHDDIVISAAIGWHCRKWHITHNHDFVFAGRY